MDKEIKNICSYYKYDWFLLKDRERQAHGFAAEHTTSYIYPELIPADKYTAKFDFHDPSGLGVSVKCTGLTSSICFADLQRQASLEEDFILFDYRWKGSKGNLVQLRKLTIPGDVWHKNFEGTENLIVEMCEFINNITNEYTDDDKWKQGCKYFKKCWKEINPSSLITINFKRDHKKQKRIQCSISHKNFAKLLENKSIIIEKIL